MRNPYQDSFNLSSQISDESSSAVNSQCFSQWWNLNENNNNNKNLESDRKEYMGWALWPERPRKGGAGARLVFYLLLPASALFHILDVFGMFKQEFVTEVTALHSDQDAQST